MSAHINTALQGRVFSIALNRPDALNAINTELRRELLEVLDWVGREPDVGSVVLTGNGNAFCSGSDLKSAAANPDTSVRRTARTILHDFQPIVETITRLDKPIIAAVNGAAVGIGMSLVLACDLVLMADTAFLLAPFINVGLIPDGGTAWFLSQRIGYARAFEVLAEGKKLTAPMCLSLGLANRIVDAKSLQEEATQWAASLATRAPLALALTKRVARLASSMGLSEMLTLEAELQTFLAVTKDAIEAIAAFREKRSPIFYGR